MLDNQKISAPMLLQDLGMKLTTKDKTYKARFGLYECFCGKEFETRVAYIKNGHTTSCGCYNLYNVKTMNIKHELINHPTYRSWSGMKSRILRKNNPSYSSYGGRGIKICDEWANDFKHFYDWSIANGWEKGLTIDRIDNDGNYEPSNCRWATKTIQSRNKRVIQINNKTGYRGVSLRLNGRYRARVVVDTKHINIGTFEKAINAAKAYDKYIVDNNLEHNINFPS